MTWLPPESPDPEEILESARKDEWDGRHDQALEKYLWFHHHALRLEPSLYAVRLSFALGDWAELASVYPPAMAALVRTRDEAEVALRQSLENAQQAFHLFRDVIALNCRLGDGLRTADLFLQIARLAPDLAKSIYWAAEPDLIAVGRFGACAPFLDPSARLRDAAENYKGLNRFEATIPPSEDAPPRFARKFYILDVVTLVGLLVLNHRTEEAEIAQAQALTVVDDEEFRALLQAAMTGHLPPSRFE